MRCRSLTCLGIVLAMRATTVPVLQALPRSSTLKGLLYPIWHFTQKSREFARSVILPAVRASTSLRKLSFGPCMLPLRLAKAKDIVAARTQPDTGAVT